MNIWSAADNASAKLPVLVWFPGGGFIRGSAAEPTYDGEALAGRGLVVVSVNYRLGAFGFFAHPELTRESTHSASGNYGLLDAVAALRWVQNNIGLFGGDAGRVTIAGQSAGGALVGNLLVSPLAAGLFHRAIGESPGSFRPLATLEHAETIGMKAGADLARLRELSTAAVLGLNANYVPLSRGLTTPRALRPIVDGWSLPAQETALFRSGRFAQVPVLVGTCVDEGSVLIGNSPVNTIASYETFMRTNFGELASEALSLYPASRDGDVRSAYANALGDTQFIYAARSIARVASLAGALTFRYLFAGLAGPDEKPAGHCDELPYVFGTLDLIAAGHGWAPIDDAQRELSTVMQECWARFVATGDPRRGSSVDWPTYQGAQDQYVRFGRDVRVESHYRAVQMSFLDRFFDYG